jgi:hypothetical protein
MPDDMRAEARLAGLILGAASAVATLGLLRLVTGDSAAIKVDAGGWSALIWHVPITAVAGAAFGPAAAAVDVGKTARLLVAFAVVVAVVSGLVSTIVGSAFPGPIIDPLFDEPSLIGAGIDFLLYSMAFFILAIPEALITVFGTRLVASNDVGHR